MSGLVEQLLTEITKKRKRIVVIGDAMIDHWVHGRVETCQDGCRKLVEESRVDLPGGAGNASRSIINWPVNVDMFAYSWKFRPHKWRFIDTNNDIVFRWDDEKLSPEVDRAQNLWAYEQATEMVNCADAVLLSDYDKGFLTPEFISSVSGICKQRGIPCVADAKRVPDLYAGCVLKCNADYQHSHNEELSRLVYDADMGQRLVVTDGPLNPVIWDGAIPPLGLGYYLPPVKCVNHVGAGDCFAAHLTLALAYGFSLKEAAGLAHSAGRVYVQHSHNRPPIPQEIVVDLSGGK